MRQRRYGRWGERLTRKEELREGKKKKRGGFDGKRREAILCPAETLKSWRYGGCLKVF